MAIVVTVNGTDISAHIKPFRTLKTHGRTFSAQIQEVSPFTLNIQKEQLYLVTDAGVVTGGGRIKSISKADYNVQGIKKYRIEGTDMKSEAYASVMDVGALRTASESDRDRILWAFSTFDTRGITVATKVLTVLATMPGPQDFTGKNLGEFMDEICKVTGADWYIEPKAAGAKELHYYVTESNPAPFAIDLQTPNNTTTFPARDFEFEDDTVEYYTDVFIIGDGISGWRKLEDYSLAVPFTPRRETSIRDNTIKDAATLDAVGKAFLLEHGIEQVQGSFDCWRPGLIAGQNISIDNDLYWVGTKTYRIQSVEPKYRDNGEATYHVKFGTIPPPTVQGLLAEQSSTDSALETAVQEVAANAPDITQLSSAGANMVRNSSFENTPGSEWVVGTGWVLNYASAQPAFHGGEVARVVRSGTASGELTTEFISVDRSDDWWFSFWSWLIARTGGNARAYIREYNAANTLLATTMLADIAAAQTIWTRHRLHFGPDNSVSGRIAFQATTVKIRFVFIFEGSANGTWEIDGVQVERGGLLTAYAPRPQELIDGQIGSTQIADDAVTTPKLIANAVTTGKLATGAVTADKVAANSIRVGAMADPANFQLVPNPGFEDVTDIVVGSFSQPIPGWQSLTYARIVNSPVDTGTYSLEMVGNGTNRDMFSDYVPVAAGKTVRFTGRVRGNTGNNVASAVMIYITWYDAGKTSLGTSATATVVVGAGTTYQDIQVVDQAVPAAAAFARISLRVTSGTPSGSEVYFDTLSCIYLDYDISHAGGNVQIDETGITIRNGVFTLEDLFGLNVMSGAGFGSAWSRFIMNGVFNGDFFGAPPTPGSNINNSTNKLPFWTHSATGSAITVKSVADTGVASGRKLEWAMAAGAASDSTYLEQIVPVNGSFARSFGYRVAVTIDFSTSLINPSPVWFVQAAYLKADKATATGDQGEGTQSTNSNAFSGLKEIVATPNPGGKGLLPIDAYYLRIRVGLRRGSAATSATLTTRVMTEVRVISGAVEMVVPDQNPADVLGVSSGWPGRIIQSGGTMRIDAGGLTTEAEFSGAVAGPFVHQAKGPDEYEATAALTLGTTTADVAGCATLSFTPQTNEYAIVIGFFDVSITVASASRAIGECYLNGTVQAAQAVAGSDGGVWRGTVGQVWVIPLTKTINYTIKLTGRKTTAAGTMQFQPVHTKMAVIRTGRV